VIPFRDKNDTSPASPRRKVNRDEHDGHGGEKSDFLFFAVPVVFIVVKVFCLSPCPPRSTVFCPVFRRKTSRKSGLTRYLKP
jgi:hypothetical protein